MIPLNGKNYTKSFISSLSHLVCNHNTGSICQIVVMVTLVCLIAGPVSADGDSVSPGTMVPIEYGYPDQSIFVAIKDSHGVPHSPMMNLAKVLMKKTDIPWQAKAYPAKRLFQNLKRGSTNFSILVRASSLKNFCLFSKRPVYSTSLNVYVLGNKPPIKSINDFAGKRIIIIRGYSYGRILKFISDPANKITYEVAGTHESAFKMLEKRRAHYLLDYGSAANYILSKHPINDIKSYPLKKLDIHLVLSKSYPDADRVMNQLEGIVSTLNVPDIMGIK